MTNLFSPDTVVNLIRRRLTSGLMALCLATGFLAFCATPAHAAGAIAACFNPVKRMPSGYDLPLGPLGYSLNAIPVTVQALYNNQWWPVSPELKLLTPGYSVGHPVSGSSCLIWGVPGHLRFYELRVVMNHRYSVGAYLADVRWSGTSPKFPVGSDNWSSVSNAYCTQGC